MRICTDLNSFAQVVKKKHQVLKNSRSSIMAPNLPITTPERPKIAAESIYSAANLHGNFTSKTMITYPGKVYGNQKV